MYSAQLERSFRVGVDSPIAAQPPDFRQASASSLAIEERLSEDVDVDFSVDVETDGPIPGPYSMLSFALVAAGTFDGTTFTRPVVDSPSFYSEVKPISEEFQREAMEVNVREGATNGD